MNFKRTHLLFIACILSVVLYACKKNNNDDPGITPDNAKLAFINLVPEALPLNMYFNGTRQTGNKITYQESSGFLTVASGQQNVSFKDTTYAQLQAGLVTLKPDSAYTIFVTGDYSVPANINTVTTILTGNTKTSPTGKPQVRFVNASPGSAGLDVYLNNVVLSNNAYKSVSGFAVADTGSVALKVKLNGTGTTILSTTVKLSSNTAYTLYGYGIINQTGTRAFNVGVQ